MDVIVSIKILSQCGLLWGLNEWIFLKNHYSLKPGPTSVKALGNADHFSDEICWESTEVDDLSLSNDESWCEFLSTNRVHLSHDLNIRVFLSFKLSWIRNSNCSPPTTFLVFRFCVRSASFLPSSKWIWLDQLYSTLLGLRFKLEFEITMFYRVYTQLSFIECI